MKNKIISIFLIMLLILTTFNALGMTERNEIKAVNNLVKKGCMVSAYKSNYDKKNIDTSSKNIFNKNYNLMKINYLENGDNLDQYQTSSCGYGWDIYETQWIAQGFTPTMEILTRVELWLFKAGKPPEGIILTVSIKDSLHGEDLVSKSISADYITDGWFEFDFSDLQVAPGETYYIVARADGGDHSNCYCWVYDVNDPYKNGRAWSSFNYGETWQYAQDDEHQDTDCCFKTYGRGLEPETPDRPLGPEEGKINEEFTYSTRTTDPLGKQVFYMWDWGDGSTTGWTGPYNSGETVTESHSWSKKGIYVIKVKAKNEDGVESGWSDPLILGIPTKKEGIDQSQEETAGWGYGCWNDYMFAQSFVPSKKTITKISLQMWREGNPKGITISIRDDLNGTDLTSIEKTGSGISDKRSWIEFDIPEIEVEPGKTYYIVWNADATDKDNTFYWCYGENNPYVFGNAWEGPPWKELKDPNHPGIDFCFRTYYAKSKNKQVFNRDFSNTLQLDMYYTKPYTSKSFLGYINDYPLIYKILLHREFKTL